MSQWMELKIHTKYDAADAVGDVFFRNGANGLVIEDVKQSLDQVSSINWDYNEFNGKEAFPEFVDIVAYLPLDDFIFKKIEEIQADIENIKTYGIDVGLGVVEYHSIEEKDWKDNWKKYFVPIEIGDSFLIKPVWEDGHYENKKIITLDPGMAFGTGSHQTTQQALRFLDKYLVKDMKVIDVGSGSGILTIASSMLGAKYILAIDNDEQAVSMTKSNILLNDTGETEIAAIKNNLLNGIDLTPDLIVANITVPILKDLVVQAASSMNEAGILICSGILDEYEMEFQKSLIENGFKIIDRDIENDWVAIVSVKVM